MSAGQKAAVANARVDRHVIKGTLIRKRGPRAPSPRSHLP